MAEHQRIALWTPMVGAAVFGTVSSSMPDVLHLKRYPHQDLHLEPRPLEAAYAMLLHLAGFETGSPAWTRTTTIGVTGRQATLPHGGF